MVKEWTMYWELKTLIRINLIKWNRTGILGRKEKWILSWMDLLLFRKTVCQHALNLIMLPKMKAITLTIVVGKCIRTIKDMKVFHHLPETTCRSLINKIYLKELIRQMYLNLWILETIITHNNKSNSLKLIM